MLRFWRLPWCLLSLTARLRSPGRLHTRGGLGLRRRRAPRQRSAHGYSGDGNEVKLAIVGAGSEVGSGRGRVAWDDGARLRLRLGV
ncbi:hypothetical protein B0H13DRAFT_2053321, partial [Mycena leptocephala]